MQVFYRAPAGCTAGRKTGNGARRKAEKEEYGIGVYCYLVCTDPPPPLPHHLSPILRVLRHLPAALVIRAGGTVGSLPPPPIPHTPFEQFETTTLDLQASL